MKPFRIQAAQGDLLVRYIDRLPADARERSRSPGEPLVVAHSESGHHHLIEADGVVMYEVSDPLVCYLRVDGDYVPLIHAKTGPHAHQPLVFRRGVVEIRRAREWNPWTRSDRRVQD